MCCLIQLYLCFGYMCLLRKAEFLIFVSSKSLLCTEVQSLNSLLQIPLRAALGLDLDTLYPLGLKRDPGAHYPKI